MNFETVDCPPTLYRVARDAETAAFVDWRWLQGVGRFDSPRIARERERIESSMRGASKNDLDRLFASEMASKTGSDRAFRTLYAATNPVGAIVEIAQGWRVERRAVRELLDILDDDPSVPVAPTHIRVPPFSIGEVVVDEAKALVDVENSVQRFRAELLETTR